METYESFVNKAEIVHAFNSGAIAFYRKLGYEVASQRMSWSLD